MKVAVAVLLATVLALVWGLTTEMVTNRQQQSQITELTSKLGDSSTRENLELQEQLSQTQAAESRAAKALKQPVGKALTPRSRGHSSSGCESEHWVESVSDDGQIIKLEDGSIWNVDAVDAIDSALWLPTTDIIACNGKLINTDDNETVSAIRIR